jgi:hypothetical protein
LLANLRPLTARLLAEQLADRRSRGQLLGPFLDAHLSEVDLRRAYSLDDVRTRRAAWRRLGARGAATPTELREIAARDEDVIVRAIAAQSLDILPEAERRALANVLINDRVGSVAVPAMNALVKLDGASSILAGLAGRLLWTAVGVLRDGTPSDAEVAAITAIALDLQRTAGQRLRALSLLRPARWAHLAALLEARERVDRADIGERVHCDAEIRAWVARSGRMGRGPTGDLRSRIERLLPPIETRPKREIEFVLETAA